MPGRFRQVGLIFALGLLCTLSVAQAAPLMPSNLRCNYLNEPLGMDDPAPRLSWIVNDPTPGAVQSAYQIRAARSREDLSSGQALLWDTGKVDSNATFQIQYDGEPLTSATRVFWQVRSWDAAGAASPWSEPTWFETGLMNAADWRGAEWISSDQPYQVYDPLEAERAGDWIGAPDTSASEVVFRRRFTAKNTGVVEAHLWMGANPEGHATVVINDNDATSARYIFQAHPADGSTLLFLRDPVTPEQQSAYVDASSWLVPGEDNVLTVRVKSSPGHRPVLCLGLTLEYADGSSEFIGTDGEWKVTSRAEKVISGIPDDGRWQTSQMVEAYGGPTYGTITKRFAEPFVPPLLRREFNLRSTPVSARAYVTGVGYHDFYLNGAKVGDRELEPGQTNYERYIFYGVHDLTGLLKQGTNVAGIRVGDGFYNQDMAWLPNVVWYGQPAAIALIHVRYADGSEEFIKTDPSWSVSTGAVRQSNIYLGETYDARKAQPGWNDTGFDDSDWKPAKPVVVETGALRAQTIPPMRPIREITPVKVTEPYKDTYVVDMGVNFTGWVRLRGSSVPGREITLRYAEQLLPDGGLDPMSTGTGANGFGQIDHIIPDRSGRMDWEPSFLYHAFRYVEVTGLSRPPTISTLTGVEVYTDVESTGSFECSDPLLNHIHEVVRHTLLSNLHSVIEDCPHRERCQWGHNSLMAEAMMFDFDIAPMYVKFVDDFYHNPVEGFGYPSNIGTGRRRSENGDIPSAGAPVEVAGFLHTYYGENNIALKNYGSMKEWIDFNIKRASGAGGFANERGRYGDHAFPRWVTQEPPRELISTLVWKHQIDVVASIAARNGFEDQADFFRRVSDAVRDRTVKKYYDSASGSFGSQSADALAIRFDILPYEDERMGRSIARDIEERNGFLLGGMVGYPKIPDALSSTGFGKWAVEGMTAEIDSSLPFQVADGYTTIWEVYHKPDSGGERHVSKNHPNYGGVAKWFYQGVAGIHPLPEHPGFRRFMLRPEVTWSLEWAKADYDSIVGHISSFWRRTSDGLYLSFTIPANSSAEVWVPVQDAGSAVLTGTGAAADTLPTVRYLRDEKGYKVFDVGAGEYRIKAPIDPSKPAPAPSLVQTPAVEPPPVQAAPVAPAPTAPRPGTGKPASPAPAVTAKMGTAGLPGRTILPVDYRASSEFVPGWAKRTIDCSNFAGKQHLDRVDAMALASTSAWVTAAGVIEGAWITYDLGGLYDLTHLKIHNAAFAKDYDRGVRQFDIACSRDGARWTTLENQVLARTTGNGVEWQTIPLAAKACRYVRLTVDSNYGSDYAGIAKVLFQGTPAEGQRTVDPSSVTVNTGVMGEFNADNWPAVNMINRSGLEGQDDLMNATTQDESIYNWVSLRNQTTGNIVWTFAGETDLESMLVWNGNDGKNAFRAVKGYNVYVSGSGSGDDWTPVRMDGELALTTNSDIWLGPEAIGLGRSAVRRVRMEILSNHGDANHTMINEVVFIQK